MDKSDRTGNRTRQLNRKGARVARKANTLYTR